MKKLVIYKLLIQSTTCNLQALLIAPWHSAVKLDFYLSSADSINTVTAILTFSDFKLVFEFEKTVI